MLELFTVLTEFLVKYHMMMIYLF